MSLVELVGWSLIHSLWEGALVALALGVTLRLVSQRRSTVRYLSSVLSLLLLVLLPPLTTIRMGQGESGVGVWMEADPAAPARTAESTEANTDPSTGLTGGNPSGAERENPAAYGDAVGFAAGSKILSGTGLRLQAIFPWLVACWTIGVLALSSRLFSAWLRTRELRVTGTSGVDPACETALARVVARLGVLRPVRILQSSILQVPAVIGWLRPVVLVPGTLVTGLTIPQLEAILAHELAHIRRHDYLINLLQALVETLLFYHPAMWWISRQARQEREHCCDDLAIRVCGDRKLYAGTLLTLEEHRTLALLPSAAGGDLLARVRRIAAPRLTHEETAPRWLAGVIAVASVLVIAGGAAFVPTGAQRELAAQDGPSIPGFSPRGAALSPDTVIRHPNPDAPLRERWEWARQTATGMRSTAFWVGYTIDPMPGVEGSIYIGRLERRGVTGNGGLNLRGRIANLGDFRGFNVPGVMLLPLIGGGMPDDVALLFAYVVDESGRPRLARVHISSLALPVDLEDRPLFWLGDSSDEESIPLVQSLFEPAPADLRPDVVAALGVHGSNATVPHLARWLQASESNDVREEAAEWLGRHPDPAALALLTRTARTDRISDVRQEAAEAVAEMNLPAATDSLIVLARDLGDAEARREAVEGLADRSDPRALAAAVEIARTDDNRDIRLEAVEALGEFDDGAGVPRLAEIARTDRSAEVRMEAIETLGEAGNPDEAIRVLRQIIEEDPDEDVAREAVETLGEIGDARTGAVLRGFARSHPRPEVRMEAIETLAELDQGSETVNILGRIAREDQNEDVQHEALESLGEMGVPAAEKLVSEIARGHASPEMRAQAVEMLVESLEPLAALEQLKLIARNDPSQDVQVEAAETIGELPAGLAVAALTELASEHPVDEVRVEALESLGEMETPEGLEVVVKVAESRASSEVRREAIETIGEHMDSEVGLRVLAGIARANDDAEAQREAVETIGESGGEQAVKVLADIARGHPNPDIRMEALETLGEIGATGLVDVLVTAATSDASTEVQEEAVESLAELPDGAGVASLIRIAQEHPNRDLRARALEALGDSDDPKARAAIDRMLQQ